MATKKSSGNKKPKVHRRRAMKTPTQTIAELRQELAQSFQREKATASENVRLFKELEQRNRDLTEALEQQNATSEVLRAIASSPTELQPVLDAVIENAVTLAGAKHGHIRQLDGELLRVVAHYNESPESVAFLQATPKSVSRSLAGRAFLEGAPVQSLDAREDPIVSHEWAALGARTQLVVPLLRKGTPIGNMLVWRDVVEPFADRQIELVKTFADQAVIAIENVRLFQELTQSLDQQTATSEILGVIASSPTDIQPVLDTVAKNAARLCGATDAQINRVEGDRLRRVASYGSMVTPHDVGVFDRSHVGGRAVIDRQTIHIHDISAGFDTEFPGARTLYELTGVRTILATPLVREGDAIGNIVIRRSEVRPFTEKQIALLETFANQAVIAIENVRLFKEIQERNAELREALEHQTATAEVLGIISRSPTDVQPVLDAIVESAARVCGIDDAVLRLRDGNAMIPRAHFGPIPIGPVRSIDEPQVRWIREHGTLHIPDVRAQNDFPTMTGSGTGARTYLLVPLRQQGEFVGVLVARRTEVRPFTPAQIKLLETFADQAVIAVENVRLFQELKEALEQQTATSEILGVIAGSPTDIQPVLDAVAESAARLCDATDAQFSRVEGNFVRQWASYGTQPAPGQEEKRPITRGLVGTRAIVDRQTVHIYDLATESDKDFPESKILQQRFGTRTILATPLLREDTPIGVINIRRTEVRPFTDKQVKLLETFASQAVIAIENVRLFKELGERNAELREALEHQTATAEVLGIISRSPTDVQPVLDAIVESAARVCGIDDVVLRLHEGTAMVVRAHFGPMTMGPAEISMDAPEFRWVREHGTLQIPDVRAQRNDFPTLGSVSGARTFLLVPLRQQGEFIGTLTARRTEVHPFTPVQIKLLETFADQAVIAIENVRLFKELQERTRELVESVEEMKALGEVGQAVSSSLDLETVLETIVSRAVDLSGTDCGVIYEFDEATQEFNLRASHRMEPEAVEGLRAARIKLGEGATGQAAMTRAPVQIPDTFELHERAVSRVRPLLNRLGYRSLLTVPILREQQIMGGLTVWRRQVGEFEPEVVNLLQTFATQSALAIQNARLFREIEDKSRQIEAANRHKSEFLANMSTSCAPRSTLSSASPKS